MKDEIKKREDSNAGYCFVVMLSPTDSVPLHNKKGYLKALDDL
jgi:hypothetical protein